MGGHVGPSLPREARAAASSARWGLATRWLRERPEVETVSTLHLEYVGPAGNIQGD